MRLAPVLRAAFAWAGFAFIAIAPVSAGQVIHLAPIKARIHGAVSCITVMRDYTLSGQSSVWVPVEVTNKENVLFTVISKSPTQSPQNIEQPEVTLWAAGSTKLTASNGPYNTVAYAYIQNTAADGSPQTFNLQACFQ